MMFYRMTRLHFEEDRFDDLISLSESMRDRVEAIGGLKFADFAKTGEGEGMIIAAYEDESDYHAASGEVTAVLGEMATYLTSTPHGHEGTVVLSYGGTPGS
jgi:hypothetical protein